MKLFDDKFEGAKGRYVLQCLLATVSILAVLVILDAIANAAVIAALGASSFIAFTMPETRSSRVRFMVGGYVVGIAVGTLCWGLSLLVPQQSPQIQRYVEVLFAALSVGLAIFVMVLTNTEHPPAASLTLGLVLSEWSVLTIVVALIGIVVLCTIKRALRPVLRNLL